MAMIFCVLFLFAGVSLSFAVEQDIN